MLRRLALIVALLAGAGPGFAAEEAHDHEAAPHKTVALGRDRILPSALTMGTSDVLVFQNFAPWPLTIRFLEPENQLEKIRCHLLDKKVAKGPGELAVFDWDFKNHLVATVAPGRFGSICSLAPGQYSYVVEAIKGTKAGAGAGEKLAVKGTITVR